MLQMLNIQSTENVSDSGRDWEWFVTVATYKCVSKLHQEITQAIAEFIGKITLLYSVK